MLGAADAMELEDEAVTISRAATTALNNRPFLRPPWFMRIAPPIGPIVE